MADDAAKPGNRYEIGAASDRPWGRWAVIDAGDRFTVKRITVSPGKRLSLQTHEHRAEHWTVVEGRAQVTLDTDVFDLGENESVFIPIGARHSVANQGDVDLIFIEVQYGEILDEDDIVRLDNPY